MKCSFQYPVCKIKIKIKIKISALDGMLDHYLVVTRQYFVKFFFLGFRGVPRGPRLPLSSDFVKNFSNQRSS